MWDIKRNIVTKKTLIILFMNIQKCSFLSFLLKSHLFTKRQHPPRGLERLVHHVVRLHADGLQLWLALRLGHFVSDVWKKWLQSLKTRSRFCCEKHAVPSVSICLCVCSDLPLSALFSPGVHCPPLSALFSALTPRLQSPGQEGLSHRSRKERERGCGFKMNECFLFFLFYSDVDGSAWWWELIHCWEKFSLNIYLYDKLMSLVGTWRETHQVHINTN